MYSHIGVTLGLQTPFAKAPALRENMNTPPGDNILISEKEFKKSNYTM
jgi:hypothetical protein